MKRLFSCLMIVNCIFFYPLLSMDKVALIPAVKSKQKAHKSINSLAEFQKNLEEEADLRNSSSKELKVKRQIQKRMKSTRSFIEELVNQNDQSRLAIKSLYESYQIFENFMNHFIVLPNGYSTEQYQKDSILLASMHNALSSLLTMDRPSQDMTQSTICVNNFQASSSCLSILYQQKSDLEEQKKRVDIQLTSIGEKIEFELLRQAFTKSDLKKQKVMKEKQVEAELAETTSKQQEIERLTMELQAKKQQVAAAQAKKTQIEDLLKDEEWQKIEITGDAT